MERNIILIGFMGTGKSVVGQRLARRLGMIFIDTDREIEKITGMSISDIFRRYGEKRFRSEEKLLARKLAMQSGLVISCGGGMVLERENMERLGRNGFIIRLDASPEDIYRRVMRKRRQRPLIKRDFTLEDLQRMMAEREEYYKCADFTIDTTSKSIEDLVRIIIGKLGEEKMRNLKINLGERSYTISIGEGSLAQVGSIVSGVARSRQVFLISNPTVFSIYGTVITGSLKQAGLEVIVGLMPDGEEYKTLGQAEEFIDLAVENQLDRQVLVLALGGGVVGDLAGFVAAVYQRGVDFVQVPTTLLAQVDSSVGGKVAVNHRVGKNIIGAFHQPRSVIIDTATLTTLSEREFGSGMAEVIKYGVILDQAFFSFLEDRLDAIRKRRREVLEEIIYRSCSIKAQVVENDETEEGLRAVLNLGHTFGHALEALTRYRKYRHGEAVAMGMVAACQLAKDLGLMKDTEVERVKGLLRACGLPVSLPAFDSGLILDTMYHDKKVQARKLRLVLPQGIGRTVIRDDISDESILAALDRARGEMPQ